MEFERSDVTRYLYTAAVLVSGMFLERWLAGYDSTVVLLVGLLIAVVWFLYYKFQLVAKLEALQADASGGSVPSDRQRSP